MSVACEALHNTLLYTSGTSTLAPMSNCHACNDTGWDAAFDSPCNCEARAADGQRFVGQGHPGTAYATGEAMQQGYSRNGGGGRPVKMASDKSVAYLRKLVAAATGPLAERAARALDQGMTQTACSEYIDALKSDVPAAPAQGAAEGRKPAQVRTNSYAGRCGSCGQQVAVQAGRIERDGTRWITFHLDGQCPAPVAPAAPLELGLYVVDGTFWLVRLGRQSGNRYAMVLVSDPAAEGKPVWDFVRGGLDTVRTGRRATAEEAASLGHATHHCCFCARELTDEGEGRSVEVGYGPTCASKNGLPWG